MSSEKMELVIYNPAEDGFLRHIDWNYKEIKKTVAKIMKDYTGLVYTGETMKQAKEDRAWLNKFKKTIEDRRKEIKEKCLEPYNAFEAEVKEITAMIDEPTALIDRQIKDYEEREKADKREKIMAAYKEAIGDLAENIPFERFFEGRYLNKTFMLKTAIDHLRGKIEKAKGDIQTIENMCGERFQVNAKDVYFQTLDLSKALGEASRLEEMERKLKEEQERKLREQEERRLREEQERKEREELRKLEEQERTDAVQDAAVTYDAELTSELKDDSGASVKTDGEKKAEAKEPETKKTQAEDETVAAVKPESKPGAETEETEEAEDRSDTEVSEARQERKVGKTYRTKFYAVGTLEQLKGLTEYMKSRGIVYGKAD